MIPGGYSLTLYEGDTATWRFVLWADKAKTDPIDLTGVAVKAEIRDSSGGATIVPLLIVVTLPNIIDAGISPAATRLIPPNARWDLQLTDSVGRISTILAGAVKVTPDITDSTPAAAREPLPAGHARRVMS